MPHDTRSFEVRDKANLSYSKSDILRTYTGHVPNVGTYQACIRSGHIPGVHRLWSQSSKGTLEMVHMHPLPNDMSKQIVTLGPETRPLCPCPSIQSSSCQEMPTLRAYKILCQSF